MNLTEGLEIAGGKVKLNIADGTKKGILKAVERGMRPSWDTKGLPEAEQKQTAYYKWTFQVTDDTGNDVDAIYTTSLKISTGGNGTRPSNLFRLLRALKPAFPIGSFKEQPLVVGLLEAIVTEIPDGKIACLLSFTKDDEGYPTVTDVVALPN